MCQGTIPPTLQRLVDDFVLLAEGEADEPRGRVLGIEDESGIGVTPVSTVRRFENATSSSLTPLAEMSAVTK